MQPFTEEVDPQDRGRRWGVFAAWGTSQHCTDGTDSGSAAGRPVTLLDRGSRASPWCAAAGYNEVNHVARYLPLYLDAAGQPQRPVGDPASRLTFNGLAAGDRHPSGRSRSPVSARRVFV
jgi:hypothetical protein